MCVGGWEGRTGGGGGGSDRNQERRVGEREGTAGWIEVWSVGCVCGLVVVAPTIEVAPCLSRVSRL